MRFVRRERANRYCPVCGTAFEISVGASYQKQYCSYHCTSMARDLSKSLHSSSSRAKAKDALTGVPKSDAHKKASGDAITVAWVARKERGNYIHIHTDDEKRRISEAKKRHLEESVGCRCGACLPHRPEPTQIELILKAHLENIYPDAEIKSYEKFGRFFVDAYVPEPYHISFEADGEYWHPIGNERDTRRDEYLQDNFGLPVIRIRGGELRRIDGKFHYVK